MADYAERAAVGQMPDILAGRRTAVDSEVPRAPVPVVRLLGQFPLGAELVQDGAFIGAAGEPFGGKPPDRGESRIVEQDAAVPPEHHHPSR